MLEEVSHWEWILRIQRPKPGPVALSALPADLDVELSTPFLSTMFCLSATVYPTMMKVDQTSEPVGKPQLHAFKNKSCHGHGVSSKQYNTMTRSTSTLLPTSQPMNESMQTNSITDPSHGTSKLHLPILVQFGCTCWLDCSIVNNSGP